MGDVTRNTVLRIVLVLITTGCLLSAHAQTIADINKLSAKLLDGYNRNTLPSNNQSEVFKIGVAAMLLDLGELDEINEKLSTVMLFYLKWIDDSMMWDVQDNNNITNITMDQESVWLPNLRLKNIHFETNDGALEKDMERVLYFANGIAIFQHVKTLHTACYLDTTKYPFDIQTCKIEMWISGYLGYSFQMDVLVNDTLSTFKGDGAWDIINSTITGNHASQVVVTFVLKRESLYTLLNVVLPIAALVFLTPTVFLLPNNTGERIGFAITTLLAISVYMTIVGSHLPAKSDPLPLISILLFVWYAMTGVIIFIVILNLNINGRSSSLPVSNAARRFVKIRRYFRKKAPATSTETLAFTPPKSSCAMTTYGDDKCSDSSLKHDDASPTESAKACRDSDEGKGTDAGATTCSRCNALQTRTRITWQDVSEAIDVVSMVIIYGIDFLVTLVYLMFVCLED